MKMPPVKMLPKFTKGMSRHEKFKAWLSRRKWIFWDIYEITLPNGTTALIPKGFILDFASIPRIFWPVLQPLGLLMLGSIVHDFAYKRGYLIINGKKVQVSRSIADDLLRDITIDHTGIKSGALIAWASVRIGGAFAWKGDKT